MSERKPGTKRKPPNVTTPFVPTQDTAAYLTEQLKKVEAERRMVVGYAVDLHRHCKGVIGILDRVGGYLNEEDQNTLRAARVFLNSVRLR